MTEKNIRKDEMSLSQKTAVVIGASRGIGLAISQSLVQEGVRVFALSRTAPPETTIPNKLIPITVDIRDPDQVIRAASTILSQVNNVDFLINNSGLEYFKQLVDISLSEIDEMLSTNLRGSILFTKTILPNMIGQKSGQIIFINSVSGLRGFAGESVYCASKYGLAGFASALEEEVRQYGIRICSIFPGATDTRISLDTWAPADDPRRAYFLQSEDVARAVIFVLNQPARVVVSQIVLRPLIELPYSDFLPVELLAELNSASQSLFEG